MKHLEGFGVSPEIYYGLDWKVTGLETQWTYEVDHPGSGFRILPKMANMHLSHYMLWKVCSYLDGDSFLILEDDVRLDTEWKDQIERCFNSLPDDWDLFYPGSCCCSGREAQAVNDRLFKTTYVLCTHAYGVRKKALKTLLDKCEKVWTHVDISILLGAMPLLNAYAIIPRIAHQLDTALPP